MQLRRIYRPVRCTHTHTHTHSTHINIRTQIHTQTTHTMSMKHEHFLHFLPGLGTANRSFWVTMFGFYVVLCLTPSSQTHTSCFLYEWRHFLGLQGKSVSQHSQKTPVYKPFCVTFMECVESRARLFQHLRLCLPTPLYKDMQSGIIV